MDDVTVKELTSAQSGILRRISGAMEAAPEVGRVKYVTAEEAEEHAETCTDVWEVNAIRAIDLCEEKLDKVALEELSGTLADRVKYMAEGIELMVMAINKYCTQPLPGEKDLSEFPEYITFS